MGPVSSSLIFDPLSLKEKQASEGREMKTVLWKWKKKIFCSHDNSLSSEFLPPGELLDPEHLGGMFQKEPEKLFKK